MFRNETTNITRLRKTKTDTKAIVNRALLSGIYIRININEFAFSECLKKDLPLILKIMIRVIRAICNECLCSVRAERVIEDK